jgi:hypothetical protein
VWLEKTIAEPAGISSRGRPTAIDHHGCGCSWRPAPLSRAARRSVPGSLCSGVFCRSDVVARRPLRCLHGTRHRHDIFGESRYTRRRSTSASGSYPHLGGSTPRHPSWRTSTCAPARRDSAQESLAESTWRRVQSASWPTSLPTSIFAISTSRQTDVKLSSNECRSSRMWCSWISHGLNPRNVTAKAESCQPRLRFWLFMEAEERYCIAESLCSIRTRNFPVSCG